jgi:hypothetical protein
LILVIATTQNVRKNAMRREFERMRNEDEWAAMLSKTRQALRHVLLIRIPDLFGLIRTDSRLHNRRKSNLFWCIKSRVNTLKFTFVNFSVQN